MDFRFSKEQMAIKKAAREFAEAEFPSLAKECDKEEKFDFDLLDKARELGFVGGIIPIEYEGPGLNFLENALIVEEFWRIDPGLAMAIIGVTFGAEIILAFGTEEQKKKYVIPLVKGNDILATAITEPDAGSDVTMALTEAYRKDDEYIINGNKMFISNGSYADNVIVYCKTNPEESNIHKQFSTIIVNKKARGFKVNKIREKLGIRASDTTEMTFTDVRVPVENLIGHEGEGFKYILNLFNRERITVCAQSVGLAQGALDQAIQHITQRVQFGRTIASFQAIRFKISEMATLIEAGRSLYYRAASGLDTAEEDHALIAMAKWYCAQNAVTIAQESLQMHGGYGFINEYDIARFYRDVKVLEIFEGTKEMEKIQIANSLLGRCQY